MREALWSLALVLAAYAAFEFLRALRLPREGPAKAAFVPASAAAAPADRKSVV